MRTASLGHHAENYRGVRPSLALAFLLLVTPCFAGQVDDLLTVGKKAFADAQYSLAIASFQKILDEYPDSALVEEADYLLGIAQFYAGRWIESLDAFSGFRARFPASSLTPRTSYWMGAALVKLGRYKDALDSLASATADAGGANPYKLNSKLLSGVALEGLGRDADAAAAYKEVLADPAAASLAAEATYRLAGTEFRAGRYAFARDLYGRVLIDNSRSPFVQDSLFYFAECELSLGNLANAQKRYETLLSLYPDSAHREAATYRLAEIAWRQKKGPAAIDKLDSLQGQYPDGALKGSALRLRADISLDQKRYDDAAAGDEAAAAILPAGVEQQQVFYSLGIAEAMLGRPFAAASAFMGAATGGSPEIAEAAGYRLALLLANGGEIAKAVTAMDSWLRAFPDSPDVEQMYRLSAELEEGQGDLAAAVSRWSGLIKDFPRSSSLPEYLFRRAAALRASGAPFAALDDYQRIVADFATSTFRNESAFAIGSIYAERGEFPRALPFFQSVARTPDAGEAGERSRLSVALCQFDMGSFAAALASFQTLRAAAPSSIPEGTIVLYAGRALYRLERLDEAASRFREAADLLSGPSFPLGADARYWLGWSYLRLGRLVESRDAFLDLARAYPQDARRPEALFRAAVAETMRSNDAAAIGLFDQVLALPRDAVSDDVREQTLYERAWALSRAGTADENAPAFEDLAREFPAGRLAPRAFFTLAEKAFDAGHYPEAQAEYLRVAHDFPRSPLAVQAQYWGAESMRRAGDVPGAVEAFWTCLAAGARSNVLAAALDGFGAALRAADSVDLARTYAGLASGVSGLSPDAAAGVRLAAADILVATQPDEALAIISEVRQDAPPEPLAGQASLLLAKYYIAKKNWDRALDALGVLESSRADEIGARAALQRGLALEAMGRTADAVDELVKVGYLFPDFADLAAEGLFNAIRLAHARGDEQRAARIEENLHATYPTSSWSLLLKAQERKSQTPPPRVDALRKAY